MKSKWTRYGNGHRLLCGDFNVFTTLEVDGATWEVVCLREKFHVIIRGVSRDEEGAKQDGYEAGKRWYEEHDRLVSELNRLLKHVAELKTELLETKEREALLTRSVEAISLICSSRMPFRVPGLHGVVSEVNELFC